MFKLVSPEIYELGQKAVAAPGWRWVPGMLSIEPMRDDDEADECGDGTAEHFDGEVDDAGDEAGGDAWRLRRIEDDGTMQWMAWCFVMRVDPEMCAVLPDLSDERTLALAREVAGVGKDADAAAVVAALI